MGIVLLILKWIGFLLLGILALVLLAVLLVLFAPIRYEIKGKQTKKWQLSMHVRWLFACIAIVWHSGMEQPKIGIQFFGRAIGSKKKEKKPKPSEDLIYTREKQVSKTVPQRMEQTQATQAAPLQEDTLQQIQDPAQNTPLQQAQTKPVQDLPSENTSEPNQPQKTFRRISLTDIEEEAPQAVHPHTEEAFAENLGEDCFTGDTTEDTDEEGGFDWKRELLHFPQKRALLCAILRLCKRLLRGIHPKHFLFSGTFGTGDPVLTGYLLAVAGILKAKFGHGLQITGDFARMTAEKIQIQIKGHITLAYFGFAVLSFVLTQPVRRLITLYLKGRKENE